MHHTTYRSELGEMAPSQQVGLIPEFFVTSVPDGIMTAEKGFMVYKEVEQIRISFAGTSGQNIIRDVRDTDRDTFAREYQAFKQGREKIDVLGTPLEEWPLINRAQADTFIYHKVRSVEELAGLSDTVIMGMGMGVRGLVEKAKTWLRSRDEGADTMAMATKVQDLEGQMALLLRERDEMSHQLAASKRAVELAGHISGTTISAAHVEAGMIPDPSQIESPIDPSIQQQLAAAAGFSTTGESPAERPSLAGRFAEPEPTPEPQPAKSKGKRKGGAGSDPLPELKANSARIDGGEK